MLERPQRLLRPGIVRQGGDGVIVNGIHTVVREAGPCGDDEAVVFIHGNPGSSADWEPLLPVVGMRAVAWDAPGFGQAGKPDDFPHTLASHGAFIGAALNALGIERAHLVLHDFGGPWGLEWAASEPERVASVTLIDTGVLLDYRWHWLARLWRTRGLGEGFMATTTRPGFRMLLRQGNPRGLPAAFVEPHVRRLRRGDAARRAAALPGGRRPRPPRLGACWARLPGRAGAGAVGRARPVPVVPARRCASARRSRPPAASSCRRAATGRSRTTPAASRPS